MGNICSCDEKHAEQSAAPLTLGKVKSKDTKNVNRGGDADDLSKIMVPPTNPRVETPQV